MSETPGNSPPVLAAPWPRFWARNLDMLLMMLLLLPLLVAVGLLVPGVADILDGQKSQWLLAILVVPLLLTMEAVCYTLCGNTPGKRLAGIRVLDARGGKLTFRRYLSRCFKLYVWGLGLGIPLVTLITMLRSHAAAAAGKLSRWDESLDTRAVRVRPGTWRTVLTAVVYLSLVVLLVAGELMTESPDNTLRSYAFAASIGLPKMINENMRLDSVKAMPDRVLQYNFSIVGRDEWDDSHYDTIRTRMKELLCSDPDAKPSRDLGSTYRYLYHDQAGKPLRQVQVTSQECAR
jgi:uncharacterized RDD family membrane protein YckC